MMDSVLSIGTFPLKHRLIQGPLAGYSCAPFRQLFQLFTAPAYCVSEMLSATDILYKHHPQARYLYRHPDEPPLCYQIAGTDPQVMAEAAIKLEALHADLIDINCGCPKAKIRKKGAGSALLENPSQLIAVIRAVRQAIRCPLTVKVRLQGDQRDVTLAQAITDAGADALIVHARRWQDDYTIPCDWSQIARIKQTIHIPVIANGDMQSTADIEKVSQATGCDAVMLSRAGMGRPWLFQTLLTQTHHTWDALRQVQLFMQHLAGLATLESEYQAVLQSRSLVRYYFRGLLTPTFLKNFNQLSTLREIEVVLQSLLTNIQ